MLLVKRELNRKTELPAVSLARQERQLGRGKRPVFKQFFRGPQPLHRSAPRLDVARKAYLCRSRSSPQTAILHSSVVTGPSGCCYVNPQRMANVRKPRQRRRDLGAEQRVNLLRQPVAPFRNAAIVTLLARLFPSRC
jgi:hypothetical protein